MAPTTVCPSQPKDFNNPFEEPSLAVANGQTHQLLTTASQFVALLEKLGVYGPQHLRFGNIDSRGSFKFKAEGSQFEVFEEHARKDIVMKRIRRRLLYPENTTDDHDQGFRSHLRTLELEIRSLCHPTLRNHPNIVNLLSWALDYPSPDPDIRLPVLIVEKARCSLYELLQDQDCSSQTGISWTTKHQLCLDVAQGLNSIHSCNIIHGDLKP